MITPQGFPLWVVVTVNGRKSVETVVAWHLADGSTTPPEPITAEGGLRGRAQLGGFLRTPEQATEIELSIRHDAWVAAGPQRTSSPNPGHTAQALRPRPVPPAEPDYTLRPTHLAYPDPTQRPHRGATPVPSPIPPPVPNLDGLGDPPPEHD